VSHVHLTAEFVLFFTGAAHPGIAGEEKRIKDWHGDHEFTTEGRQTKGNMAQQESRWGLL
jgi:hypothetical protein